MTNQDTVCELAALGINPRYDILKNELLKQQLGGDPNKASLELELTSFKDDLASLDASCSSPDVSERVARKVSNAIAKISPTIRAVEGRLSFM